MVAPAAPGRPPHGPVAYRRIMSPESWRPRTPPPLGQPAVRPGPGQESVWDYPRPPAVDPSEEHVVVQLGLTLVAETRRALRVLETSHPPTYYLPADDVTADALVPVPRASTFCEFKGRAVYFDVVGVDGTGARVVVPRGAWSYPDPAPGYEALAGRISLYPGRMTRVTVDGEPVLAQEGDFYGGWRTSRVVGPFKGAPGTRGW
jgi:uncharacterized protein (DUF427 family)